MTMILRRTISPPSRPLVTASRGMLPLLASDAFAGLVGFVVLVAMARKLGPQGFADVEAAAALAAVLLVIVRSGIESIVIREAARKPVLIGPLTDTLIGLKLVGAIIGFAVIGIAAMFSDDRFWITIAAGSVLLPSAFVADVGTRALARWRLMAVVQCLRSLAFLLAILGLVRSTDHGVRAALGLGLAESVAMISLMSVHHREYGWPKIRLRIRAWRVLAVRGTVASLSRFGRVLLYGADILVLGWGPHDFGSYAASRRVVFALVALGLVVPTALAPAIARGWAAGVDEGREAIHRGVGWLTMIAFPASLGLMLTAQGWTATLFGNRYENGGATALILVAARMPLLLVASFYLAALVAVRREDHSLKVVAAMLLAAAIILPFASFHYGPTGAGAAMLAIEVVGVVAGWLELRGMNIQPSLFHADAATGLATLAMVGVVLPLRNESPVWVSILGASTYGIVRRIASRRTGR